MFSSYTSMLFLHKQSFPLLEIEVIVLGLVLGLLVQLQEE